MFSKQRIVFLKLLKSHLMKEEKVDLLEDQYITDCLPASKEIFPLLKKILTVFFFIKCSLWNTEKPISSSTSRDLFAWVSTSPCKCSH